VTSFHPGAAFAGNLDLQHVRVDGNVELESIAVIADVPDRAGKDIPPVRPFTRGGDRYVFRTDQDDGVTALGRSRRTACGMYSLAAPDLHGKFVPADLRDCRGQQVRVAQEIGHEQVGGRLVERARRAHLGDTGLVHDHDEI